jgi:hypothetical protein
MLGDHALDDPVDRARSIGKLPDLTPDRVEPEKLPFLQTQEHGLAVDRLPRNRG